MSLLDISVMTGSDNALNCSDRQELPFVNKLESGDPPDPPTDHFSYRVAMESVNEVALNERLFPVDTLILGVELTETDPNLFDSNESKPF